MTLQDLFNQLAMGELAQISLSNNGRIEEENQLKLLPTINLGITELHTRFLLREGNLLVFKAIKGEFTHEIQESNFLIVDSIYGPDVGEVNNREPVKKYVLDLEGRSDSIMLPSWNTVYFNKNLPQGFYKIVYRAKHDQILPEWVTKIGASRIALPIPPSHVRALELFVAAQLLNPMGFDGEMHEGNNYIAQFEKAVQQLGLKGFHRTMEVETPNFENNGWI